MRSSASGLARFTLKNNEIFLAWRAVARRRLEPAAVVAPIAEITAESQTVAMAIGDEAGVTVRWTLWITTLLFGLALAATVVFTRRFLTVPIERLVTATQKVAAGDRSVSLPVHAQDELGQLANAFNQMTEQIVQAQQTLEARVSDRTRDLSALYAVTTVASRSLDQDTVLVSSLDQVLTVMNCLHGMIHLWDDQEQVLKLAAHRQIPEPLLPNLMRVPCGEGLIGWVIEQRQPLVIDDIADDARLSVHLLQEQVQARGFVGVPMHVQNRIVGVLSVVDARTAFQQRRGGAAQLHRRSGCRGRGERPSLRTGRATGGGGRTTAACTGVARFRHPITVQRKPAGGNRPSRGDGE
ncbi:MAG: HAMP domain-containing protein [Caldilineaceae bacterium]